MKQPLRLYNDYLYVFDVQNRPGTPVNNVAIPSGTLVAASTLTNCFVGFPLETGIYPLSLGDNQICLQWNITAMPTAATYIEIVPISFPGFYVERGAGTAYAVCVGEGISHINFFTWDNLSTANQVNPNNYAIRRTAIDPIVTINNSVALADPFNMGTQHIIPVISPYMGFYIRHNGTDNTTGSHSLLATLRWD